MKNPKAELTVDEIEFLQQSNYIENEPSFQAMDDAVKAWLFLKAQTKLTHANIQRTHKILMKSRKIEAEYVGVYRKINVRVGTRRCPEWRVVPQMMDNFLQIVGMSIASARTPDRLTNEEIEENIRADHILFEKTHPFVDGNGRIGRMILNWERITLGLPILVIKEEDRFEYYKWF